MKTAVKVKRQAVSRGIEKICAHYIEWRLYGKGLKLSAIDLEQITNSLIDNCIEGELCTLTPNGDTANGWWSIQWQY
jgi:hypothetical protein